MSGSGARGASDRADAAFDRAFELAPRLFHEIGMRTRADRGVTRAPYDSGESAALEILSAEACAHGLQVGTDAAANLDMTVPGAEPESPCLIIGSHLDSVPNGGNYDGLAGVVAQRARNRPRVPVGADAARIRIPAVAPDLCDHANRAAQALEHRPLLDV